MDRTAYNALLAQYATPEVSGYGRVSWDGGVKCVMPSIKLWGKCEQKTLESKNLWTTDAEYPIRNGGIDRVLYDAETQTYEIPAGDNMSISRSIYTLPEPIPAGTTITIAAFFDSGRMTGTISFGGYHVGDTKSWQGVINIATNTDLAGKKYTKTFVTTDTVTDFWVFLYGDTVVTETIHFRMMYVIGDSVRDWEPYTAGVPMPSPELPSPIRCNNGTFCGTSADGAHDGGIAQAPELLAIPGTEYRDEWDCQTGWGVRRCKVIKDSGTGWSVYDSYNGFVKGILPETLNFASGLCNQFTVLTMHGGTGVRLGANNKTVYLEYNPYYDESLSDKGLSAWMSHLQEEQLTFVVPISSEPFYYPPARLTMPNGPGQIIQTGGDVADCPITARYLTHS